MKKKLIILGGVAAVLLVLLYLSLSFNQSEKTIESDKIAVFQVVRHPVLDAMAQSFENELKRISSMPIVFTAFVADGDAVKTEQMAQQIATSDYRLAFVIGTGQAQSLARKNKSLPIVLGGATDPVKAKLVQSWEQPGANVTGTSDLSPVGTQLDRLLEIHPSVHNIGIIYNPLEDNSKAITERFKTECQKRGLIAVAATVSNQNEIKQTFISLIGKIDALYAPTDATIQQAFSVLSKLGNELKIPIFNCDKGTVENGAIFSVGFSYEELGRVSAQMAEQILSGKSSPDTMAIRFADQSTLFYNPNQINFFGLTLPENWKNEGEQVAQ